ncbi:MAG TPA: AAA family ATPase, partial [Pirellulales bacterium]
MEASDVMGREAILRSDDSSDDDFDDGAGFSPTPSRSSRRGNPAESLEPAAPEERKLHEHLRPQRLRDVIGQREVCERLEIVLDASKKRGEPIGHILFDGPPGLGKTTFATVIPRELDTTVQIANAASLKSPSDIMPYLTNASAGSVLFIDEIHRLPKSVEEFLYPVMEDFRVDIVLGEGMNARTINLQLRPFTLIGATTRAGMLSAPMRNRFQMREHLDFYTVAEL